MTFPPLAPAWSALAGRVVAEYRAAIGDDLVAIALFGSVARGRARPDSDLDLYVVTRRPSLGDSRLHGTWDRIDASPEYQALVRAGTGPHRHLSRTRWTIWSDIRGSCSTSLTTA